MGSAGTNAIWQTGCVLVAISLRGCASDAGIASLHAGAHSMLCSELKL